MLESAIVQKIRENMKDRYNVTLHKMHGGPYTETGTPDLFGTLPGGRAIYVEVKTPATINVMDKRRKYQDAWLKVEAKQGAFTFVTASWQDLLIELIANGIYPQKDT